MANIQKYLNDILKAIYGKHVRGSIHDAIDAINKEVESTTGKQDYLDNKFTQLIINAGNSNAEIVDARVDNTTNPPRTYTTLGERLDDLQQHQLIPHITYREVGTTPVTALANENGELLLTHDEQPILVGEHQQDSHPKSIAGVKIPDLPSTVPKSEDLIVVETKDGTSKAKVSDLKSDLKYTQI